MEKQEPQTKIFEMITKKLFRTLIALMLIWSFSPALVAQEDPEAASTLKFATQDSSLVNILWRDARNAKDSSLLDLYAQDAIKVISEDMILTGPDEIHEHYSSQATIKYVDNPFSTEANKYRGITYAVNFYKPENAAVIVQLVIYEKEGDTELRAFEYDAARPILNPENIPDEVNEQLKERRKQWMAYCNAHDVPGLVYDLYSHNTMYFNHRPLVKGREALVREYAYMNNEQYSLTLLPRHMTFVNDNTVFEIGQCEGSYNGKYILIWKKEEDGVWRIFIDSNV